MNNLNDVLIEQLKDIFSAESQLIEALPSMVKGAENAQLKKAIQDHFEETKNQLKRLEKVSKLVDEKLDGHTCKAMKGLLQEGSEVLKEKYKGAGIKDVMIVAAAQRVEHYEMAAYGNAIAVADFLGLSDVSDLLRETIREEENADSKLTEICESYLFTNCECEDDDASSREELNA